MVAESIGAGQDWSVKSPHVKKALAFIRKKRTVTAEQMVEWDAVNGRHLFNWNNPEAAQEHRLYQARTFFNSFRRFIDGKLRARLMIHLPANEGAGIAADAYFLSEDIAESPKLRAMVIEDLTDRMGNLAKELRLWKLKPAEILRVLAKVREALSLA